ncbi:MAG: hypothetical protein ACT4QG_20015 [Sporichthyaceae bacterium]
MVYARFSDPTRPDLDSDGLTDAEEADLGLDPADPDSDHDNLGDAREVQTVGSDPLVADTDGDGMFDGDEDAQGRSPLLVEVPGLSGVADFGKGALLGEFNHKDNLAWLLGNLTAGGSSLVPGVGWVTGTVFDSRDALGAALNGDLTGAGLSAVGLVPGFGDAVAIPGKVAAYVARHPDQAAVVAAAIAGLASIPLAIKVAISKRLTSSWDVARAAGASDEALLALLKGQTNLDVLAASVKRSGHVAGKPAPFLADGPAGERFLLEQFGAGAGATTQVVAKTSGCILVCNAVARRFDVVVDGVAHESKVGKAYLTPALERQIRSDAYLIKNGDIKGAHWHFFPSAASNTLGADRKLLDLLDELKIPYTVHLPA